MKKLMHYRLLFHSKLLNYYLKQVGITLPPFDIDCCNVVYFPVDVRVRARHNREAGALGRAPSIAGCHKQRNALPARRRLVRVLIRKQYKKGLHLGKKAVESHSVFDSHSVFVFDEVSDSAVHSNVGLLRKSEYLPRA